MGAIVLPTLYALFLNSPAELVAIGPGYAVNRIFVYRAPFEEWESDLIWATVIIAEGDRLEFRRHNIVLVNVREPERATGPDGVELRTLWDLCFEDDCVLKG